MLVVASGQQSVRIEVSTNQTSGALSQEKHLLPHNWYFSTFLAGTESDFAENLKKVNQLLD